MKTISERIFYVIFLTVLLFGCSANPGASEGEFLQNLKAVSEDQLPQDDMVVTVLEQIPSPLEISVLLKQSGTKYNQSVLNPTRNITKYNTNFKKALNLGVYGADLGYANIYGLNADGVRYLSSIQSLADDLNMGQFFDLKTFTRLASSSNNLDSLLLVTTENFNAINRHLQSQNRAHLSLLLLVGGWVEAMQLICQAAAIHRYDQQLIERVGEQKIILEQIVLLMSFYKNDVNMMSLLNDLEQLSELYSNVDIIHTYKDARIVVVNGVAVVEDNSTTTISITEKDAAVIKSKVNSIRSKIIS
jgi:hypothetical protein